MFAIVDIAGFQEKVEKGMKLRVPLLDAKEGDTVVFDKVYLLAATEDDVQVGMPLVSGVSVQAKVTSHGKTDKIRVLKFKRRKRYLKIAGHRQDYSDIEITDIGSGAKKPAAKKDDAKPAKKEKKEEKA